MSQQMAFPRDQGSTRRVALYVPSIRQVLLCPECPHNIHCPGGLSRRNCFQSLKAQLEDKLHRLHDMTATDLDTTAIEPTVFPASRDTYLDQHLRRRDNTQV